MKKLKQYLEKIPSNLLDELLKEYENLLTKYYLHEWRDSELSGAFICEVIYKIIIWEESGRQNDSAEKPVNFYDACTKLQNSKNLNRSMKILIPRLLIPLYEIRHNRNVGHSGGEVDSNAVDANLVVNIVNWLIAELVRIYYSTSLSEAQAIVNQLSEFVHPIIWQKDDIKRVVTNHKTSEKVLLLLFSNQSQANKKDLQKWTMYKNTTNFTKLLEKMSDDNLIHIIDECNTIHLLPKGKENALKIANELIGS